MSMDTCLITGADFLDVTQDRWIHGDLHQFIDVLIFNANGCEWHPCADVPLPGDSLAVKAPIYYEKNKQIVFPILLAEFNEAAHAFLTKNLRETESQIITFGKPH